MNAIETDNPATEPLPPCPRCGSTGVVEILYGYPTADAFEAERRGDIALGGCVIGDESPDYICRACREPLPWARPDLVQEDFLSETDARPALD